MGPPNRQLWGRVCLGGMTALSRIESLQVEPLSNFNVPVALRRRAYAWAGNMCEQMHYEHYVHVACIRAHAGPTHTQISLLVGRQTYLGFKKSHKVRGFPHSKC